MNVAHINRIISTTPKVNVDSIETYSNDYHAADFGDNDQINKQATIELIADSIITLVIEITPGSAYPLVVTDIGDFVNGGTGINQFLKQNDGVEWWTDTINDILIRTFYEDGSYGLINRFEIYGHEDPDNPGFTIDDCVVVFYK